MSYDLLMVVKSTEWVLMSILKKRNRTGNLTKG